MQITEFTVRIEHRFQAGDLLTFTGRSRIGHDFYNKEHGGIVVTGLRLEGLHPRYTYASANGKDKNMQDSVYFIDENFDKVRPL